MKQWFTMMLKKEEFDFEARKLLDSDQTRLHNEFLLSLLNKVAFPSSNEFKRRTIKKSKAPKPKRFTDTGGFQPADPVQFLPQLQPPPQKLQDDAQRYCVQDFFLPDFSFILGRLMLGAWESGLNGADDDTAECLVVAVQYFLKNVLTAVITMRKGYKTSENGLIHSIGSPIPNPWIRNLRKRPRESDFVEEFDEDEEDGLIMISATQRGDSSEPDKEQLEAFELACAPIPVKTPEPQPISAYDLLNALVLHPSTIPSHSVYDVNLERIIACLNHPTLEELEAAQLFDSRPT